MAKRLTSQSKLIKSVQELALKLLSFLSTDLRIELCIFLWYAPPWKENRHLIYTSQTKGETTTETSYFREAIVQFCGFFSAAGFEHNPLLTLSHECTYRKRIGTQQ